MLIQETISEIYCTYNKIIFKAKVHPAYAVTIATVNNKTTAWKFAYKEI